MILWLATLPGKCRLKKQRDWCLLIRKHSKFYRIVVKISPGKSWKIYWNHICWSARHRLLLTQMLYSFFTSFIFAPKSVPTTPPWKHVQSTWNFKHSVQNGLNLHSHHFLKIRHKNCSPSKFHPDIPSTRERAASLHMLGWQVHICQMGERSCDVSTRGALIRHRLITGRPIIGA